MSAGLRERAWFALRPARRAARRLRRAGRETRRWARWWISKRGVRTAIGLTALEDLTGPQRLALWPAARPLEARNVRNCRVVENREAILERLPKGGVCCELGILRGDFSARILALTQPARLHLVDRRRRWIDGAAARFQREVTEGRVELHLGDSADTLLGFPDRYFDWIYIDGDHSYPGVKRDLDAARRKLKPEGLLVLNDYIFFSPVDLTKYGVVDAVNELCLDDGWELLYFALQTHMYCDVALRRLAPDA